MAKEYTGRIQPGDTGDTWHGLRGTDGTSRGADFKLSEEKIREMAPELFPKHAGGRPPKYDYYGMLIHLADICFNDAAFRNPSEDQLLQAAAQWMSQKNPTGGPDRRELRKYVHPFYERVFGGD